jgi:catechol 2,3-dioxygenase-like lactoylglutathione lyase family enzyme
MAGHEVTVRRPLDRPDRSVVINITEPGRRERGASGRPQDSRSLRDVSQVAATRIDWPRAVHLPDNMEQFAQPLELTHLLVVADVERSRAFYAGVLGASVYREYGGTSCVLKVAGTWLLLVTAGGPTPDKPTVTFAPPVDPDMVSHELVFRVPDCRAAYQELMSRGARFLSPPVESMWEVRAFFRDPDGHLLEISETR